MNRQVDQNQKILFGTKALILFLPKHNFLGQGKYTVFDGSSFYFKESKTNISIAYKFFYLLIFHLLCRFHR